MQPGKALIRVKRGEALRAGLIRIADYEGFEVRGRMSMSAIEQEPAMSLNVSLPAEMEQRVREHVASGLYGSASEVIRDALRLFEAYQSVQASHLAALKADIQQGLADVQAGKVAPVDMASIKAKGRAALRAKELG